MGQVHMKLISTAHLLVKSGRYWVGFNEYGTYIATNPYIKEEKERLEIIHQAVKKAQQLGKKVYHGR
jgi:hypothetical protein